MLKTSGSFDLFLIYLNRDLSIRAKHMTKSYPAWTAIEVAGFVREGAVVEIRCIARR
jgi:enamine deaminase RidA (YjgF/YER057c/UK114 family)